MVQRHPFVGINSWKTHTFSYENIKWGPLLFHRFRGFTLVKYKDSYSNCWKDWGLHFLGDWLQFQLMDLRMIQKWIPGWKKGCFLWTLNVLERFKTRLYVCTFWESFWSDKGLSKIIAWNRNVILSPGMAKDAFFHEWSLHWIQL